MRISSQPTTTRKMNQDYTTASNKDTSAASRRQHTSPKLDDEEIKQCHSEPDGLAKTVKNSSQSAKTCVTKGLSITL